MRARWLTVAVVGAVFLGLGAYLFVYSVPIDRVAAHYRLGKVMRVIRPRLEKSAAGAQIPAATEGVEVIEEAGWFFKLPWPFDEVTDYDQRIRELEGRLVQTQLPDGNQVIPRTYATWRIVDPVAFKESLKGDEESAVRRLKTIIMNDTNEVFGHHNLEDVVNTDPAKLKFDQIEQEIFAQVKDSLEKTEQAYGVEVCSLGLTWIALPDDVTSSVFGRMEKERNRVAQGLLDEGEKEKRTQVAEAQEERDRILADAQAEAKKIRAEGEAEAAEYYVTFAEDPELAIFLRRLEAFKNIAMSASDNGQPLTLVLSTKAEPFGILESGPLKQVQVDEGGPALDLQMPSPLALDDQKPAVGRSE